MRNGKEGETGDLNILRGFVRPAAAVLCTLLKLEVDDLRSPINTRRCTPRAHARAIVVIAAVYRALTGGERRSPRGFLFLLPETRILTRIRSIRDAAEATRASIGATSN